MAIAARGQPLDQVMGWTSLRRKAFIYTLADMEGMRIDWATGGITKPPQE